MLIDRSYDYRNPTTGETRHIENIIDTTYLSHGKYNCSMAVYLDLIVRDGGEDEWAGDGETGESTSRVGRWLISYDDQGFIEAYKYDSLAAAETEMARIRDAVKNLGWLLRHASESYKLEACRDRYAPGEDGPLEPNLLRVIGTHPITGAVWTYWVNFADWSVLQDWITRPAFAHLEHVIDDDRYHLWVKSTTLRESR